MEVVLGRFVLGIPGETVHAVVTHDGRLHVPEPTLHWSLEEKHLTSRRDLCPFACVVDLGYVRWEVLRVRFVRLPP